MADLSSLVIPGLVPGTHVLGVATVRSPRRGWFSLALGRRPHGARQAHDEFGKLADAAFDIDAAAMAARHDIIADGEAEPGTLAGRLGREERREQLGADPVGNAYAVIAHADLDRLAEVSRRNLEGRLEFRLGAVALALVGGIEAVADEVEEDPRQILRRRRNHAHRGIEIPLHRDVEALILGAQAMVGERQRLFEERVELDGLHLAAAAARMEQHALDDAVGAPPMLADLA